MAAVSKINHMVPNPSTERGVPAIISTHPTLNKVIYASGRSIIIRDLDNPLSCEVYREHNSLTTVAKFSHNGYYVASGDSSGKVRVWPYPNPQNILKLEYPAFNGPVVDLDWDFEAKKLVAVGEGGQFFAKCFTWDTGNSVGEMVGSNKRVISVAFKKSRPPKIMTGSMDFSTVFYAGPPFKFVRAHQNLHSNFVNCVRYSPDDTKIVSVGSDRRIQLYDGVTGDSCGEVIDAHSASIYSVCFSPDSSKLVTSSGDKTLKVWDVNTLVCEATIKFSPQPQLCDMQNSVVWNKSNIVSLSLSSDINLFDPVSFQLVKTIQSHKSSVISICKHPTTGEIFSGCVDGVVCALDPQTGLSVKLVTQVKNNITNSAHEAAITGITTSGPHIISTGYDSTIRFADMKTKQYFDSISCDSVPLNISSGGVPGIYAVIFKSEVIVYNGREKMASSGKISFEAVCVAIYLDQEVSVGGGDNYTHVYSITDGKLIEITKIATRSAVTAIDYSPNGDVVAIGDAGRQVEVYERGTWACKIQYIWCFHTSGIKVVRWDSTGRYLASGGSDEKIFIWDYSTKNKIEIAANQKGGVVGVEWLSQSMILSSGADSSFITWKLPFE